MTAEVWWFGGIWWYLPWLWMVGAQPHISTGGIMRPCAVNEAWKQQPVRRVRWMSGGQGGQGVQAVDMDVGDSILSSGWKHAHIQKCHPVQI